MFKKILTSLYRKDNSKAIKPNLPHNKLKQIPTYDFE